MYRTPLCYAFACLSPHVSGTWLYPIASWLLPLGRLSSLETVIVFVNRCKRELLLPSCLWTHSCRQRCPMSREDSPSLETEQHIYSICFTCWHTEDTSIFFIVVIFMLCFFLNFRFISSAHRTRYLKVLLLQVWLRCYLQPETLMSWEGKR